MRTIRAAEKAEGHRPEEPRSCRPPPMAPLLGAAPLALGALGRLVLLQPGRCRRPAAAHRRSRRVALAARSCGRAAPASRCRAAARLWGAFAVMGLLNNALPFALIVWGQSQFGAGVAAILNASDAALHRAPRPPADRGRAADAGPARRRPARARRRRGHGRRRRSAASVAGGGCLLAAALSYAWPASTADGSGARPAAARHRRRAGHGVEPPSPAARARRSTGPGRCRCRARRARRARRSRGASTALAYVIYFRLLATPGRRTCCSLPCWSRSRRSCSVCVSRRGTAAAPPRRHGADRAGLAAIDGRPLRCGHRTGGIRAGRGSGRRRRGRRRRRPAERGPASGRCAPPATRSARQVTITRRLRAPGWREERRSIAAAVARPRRGRGSRRAPRRGAARVAKYRAADRPAQRPCFFHWYQARPPEPMTSAIAAVSRREGSRPACRSTPASRPRIAARGRGA